MDICKPTDFFTSSGSMSIFYGGSGAGKTILAGSFAAKYKTLFLNTEGLGPQSLNAHSDWFPNLDIINIDVIADFDTCIERLLKGDHDYKAVALDSLTNFQFVMSDEIIQNELKNDAEDIKKGRKVYKPHDPDMLEQMDWGKIMHRMWLKVTKLQYLALTQGIHVAVTCQLGEKLDPRDKEKREMIYYPSLRGAWQTMIGQYFSLYAYLSGESYQRDKDIVFQNKLYTQSLGNYQAKSRYRLPAVIDNPNMVEIIDEIQKQGKNNQRENIK